MKRLLTAGIFGTILGIVGAYSTANASIVSSGFLDEKLTEMTNATTLQLDTKANQSDLDFIGMQVDPEIWNDQLLSDVPWSSTDAAPIIEELFPYYDNQPYVPAPISPTLLGSLSRIDMPGIAGFTYKLLNGWTDKSGIIINPGIKAMFEGWTVEGGTYFPGLYNYSKGETLLQRAYDSDNSGLDFSRLLIKGANATTIDGVDYTGPVYPLWKLSEGIDKIGTWPGGPLRPSKGLTNLLPETINMTFPTSIKGLMIDIYDGYWSISNLAEAVYYGNEYRQKDPALVVKGLRQITDEIGTLPSGRFTPFPAGDNLFPALNQPLTYPTSLAELITAIYGNSETKSRGLLEAIIAGFMFDSDGDGSPDEPLGLIPNFSIAKNAHDKIGALPTEIPNEDSIWARYGFVERTGTPIELPDTIGGMFAMLFNEDGTYNGLSLRNIMVKTLMGYVLPSGARTEGLVPLTSVYNLTGDSPIVTAVNANTAAIEKIGTLPTEYATVGAALSAIKGIAEEAKTAALAAIPDPKQEGSSGKFVLTVDIIGDNATYRWEKIDRESEPTTTE